MIKSLIYIIFTIFAFSQVSQADSRMGIGLGVLHTSYGQDYYLRDQTDPSAFERRNYFDTDMTPAAAINYIHEGTHWDFRIEARGGYWKFEESRDKQGVTLGPGTTAFYPANGFVPNTATAYMTNVDNVEATHLIQHYNISFIRKLGAISSKRFRLVPSVEFGGNFEWYDRTTNHNMANGTLYVETHYERMAFGVMARGFLDTSYEYKPGYKLIGRIGLGEIHVSYFFDNRDASDEQKIWNVTSVDSSAKSDLGWYGSVMYPWFGMEFPSGFRLLAGINNGVITDIITLEASFKF